MFDAEFNRRVARPAWKSKANGDENLAKSEEEKPSNEEVCGEKVGELQKGGPDSKKKKLGCSTWHSGGRTNKSEKGRRGRR